MILFAKVTDSTHNCTRGVFEMWKVHHTTIVTRGNQFLSHSKNAPHLESAITLGAFVQMFATANRSGGTPKKESNNILLDPSRKIIFRSTGEIGASDELH